MQRVVWVGEPNHDRADVTVRVSPHVHRLPCPLVLGLPPIRVTAGPPSDSVLLATRSRPVVRYHRSVIVVSVRACAALVRSPIVVSPLSNRRWLGSTRRRCPSTVIRRSSFAAHGTSPQIRARRPTEDILEHRHRANPRRRVTTASLDLEAFLHTQSRDPKHVAMISSPLLPWVCPASPRWTLSSPPLRLSRGASGFATSRRHRDNRSG